MLNYQLKTNIDTDSQRLLGRYLKRNMFSCCTRKVQCITSKSVMLIILWDILTYAHVILLRSAITSSYFNSSFEYNRKYYIFSGITFCLSFLSFPLFGLLADIKMGRYKTIITGTYLLFVAWIFGGLVIIVSAYISFNPLHLFLLFFCYLFQIIGYCSVRSNIVQFSIDQSVEASTDELSAIIYWHSVCIPMVYAIVELGQIVIKEYIIVSYAISGVAVSTVIITNFLFNHWLYTIPHIFNPVKLIVKVLDYARKNKYPQNRSALTNWEEDNPSRLDLGKEKYGGPFSEDEIEDVKTVLKLTPLFICVIGLCCIEEISWDTFYSKRGNRQIISSIFYSSLLSYLFSSILILLHVFVIYPCFFKCIPSMLKRIGLGLVFAFLSALYYVILFACQDHLHLQLTLYKAIIVPQILFGIAFAFILPTSLEFFLAQSPNKMRGFILGLWYASFGIGYVINVNGKYPFQCIGNDICQSPYYYALISAILLVILICFLMLAKRYKLRIRKNEVYKPLVAEETNTVYHERYMEEEKEYRRDMGLSLEYTD